VGAYSKSRVKVNKVSTCRREMKVCPPGPGLFPSMPVRLRAEGLRLSVLGWPGGETT
jgi:hypothetical protein